MGQGFYGPHPAKSRIVSGKKPEKHGKVDGITQRSNIEVQNLGGPNLVVADDLRLFSQGGREETGKALEIVISAPVHSGRSVCTPPIDLAAR